MLDGLLAKEKNKKLLEKRSFENLVICNSLALSNLPIKGECILDLSKDGEYVLASNKSTICLAHTLSHLYNPLLRHKHDPKSCCCDSYLIKYTPPRSNVVKKTLKYKTRCTSSLWYSNDNSIFLTGGDSSIDVWDSSIPEVAYSFSNLPSLVKYLAVANSSSVSPTIAGGLSCGTISLCDTRYGSSTNFCKPGFSASVSVMKFLKHNDNQLIAGYENSSVLVWDLRRFNTPLCSISNIVPAKTNSIIWGCSFNSGPLASNLIRENHSFDFKTEEEVWNYIKAHETGSRGSGSSSFEENKFPHGGRGRGRGNSRRRQLDLSSHAPKSFASQMSYISAETQSYFGGVKTDLSTDIKISDVDLNVYISYKNGVIESYNSTSFKVLRSIDVNSFNNLLPWENPQKKYSQKMKIELICQDSFVLFNNSDSVGMVSLKDGSLNRYIRMRNDERDGVFAHLSDGNAPECCDPSCSTSRATQPRDVMLLKGVSDIATIPSIREIYIINESGQLFVLHPEYKKLFKQA